MSSFNKESLPSAFQETLTEYDIQKNSTLQSFDQIEGQLEILAQHQSEIDSILDIGCGRGGFVDGLGKYVNATNIYGIDIDSSKRDHAERRGIQVFDVDIRSEKLPFDDGEIDLIVSFGLLEHLPYYTTLFEETVRVLETGWFWLAAPNLASWINRLAILFGYQPRNVEISRHGAVGSLPVYNRDKFLNHVSAPTYRALIDLLEYYDFRVVDSTPLSPYQRSFLDKTIDRICNLRTGLGRRIAVLSQL